ncbi:MAG: nitrous oxide reductase accessory protein NosL [Alphaproteobacteria bacterium]
MAIDRRTLLSTASMGAVFAFAAPALGADKPMSPMAWTDKNGLVNKLPKDTEPLKDELKKYPRCPYCGMMRAKFSHSRHLLVYEDDSVDGTCSIHCAAISLSLNMDRGPKAIYAGDAGSDEKIKPLVLSDKASYVLDAKKPGTMTKVSKLAYGDKAKAEAAAKGDAKIVGFDEALTAAYLDMANDTIMIRKKRAEMRKKMKMKMGGGHK